MAYSVFDPKVDKPLHEVSREEAREAYAWFMDNILVRLEQLASLVNSDGLSLDFSEESLSNLNNWFFEVVGEERELGNTSPSPELFSVCNDIGIYLAEAVVRVVENVRWDFFIKDKKGLSYQRPVITGFNVKNRNYYIDFDYLICQYAFRILKSGEEENGLFLAMYKKAVAMG